MGAQAAMRDDSAILETNILIPFTVYLLYCATTIAMTVPQCAGDTEHRGSKKAGSAESCDAATVVMVIVKRDRL